MSPWVPVVFGGVFATLSIAERFYARFVPDVSDQKRHLRMAAWGALNLLSFSSVGWTLWLVAHDTKPVTPQLVISVGAAFFTLTLLIVSVILYKGFGLTGNALREFLMLSKEHIDLTCEEAKVLDMFTSEINSSEDVKKKIRGLFEQIDRLTR